jgi:hypothetical protein
MWARITTLTLGVWLMSAPGLFGFAKTISNNGHIIGPLIVSFSIISFSECTRNARWLNLPLAMWLLFSPWILAYDNWTAFASDYAVGILILFLSIVKQERKKSFGGGWPVIWTPRKI